MHGATQATLKQLREARWFGNVGLPWRGESVVQVVSSWAEAFESCADPAWEELQLEAANRFREKLLKASAPRLNDWNTVAAEVRVVASKIVAEKSQAIERKFQAPKSFIASVEWDVAHLLMEAEFSDVCSPGFFASQGFWYMEGRFPCGWKGAFPLGTLVIY